MSQQITCDMYFDEYERELGDGFYPLMNNNTNLTTVSINFKYNKLLECWVQLNEDAIMGLDGDTGKELLFFLNNKSNPPKICSLILNKNGIIIYPK